MNFLLNARQSPLSADFRLDAMLKIYKNSYMLLIIAFDTLDGMKYQTIHWDPLFFMLPTPIAHQTKIWTLRFWILGSVHCRVMIASTYTHLWLLYSGNVETFRPRLHMVFPNWTSNNIRLASNCEHMDCVITEFEFK